MDRSIRCKTLFSLLFLMVCGTTLPAFAIPQIHLEAPEEVEPGEAVTVQVLLEEGEGIGQLKLTIGYNAEQFLEPQITAGDLGKGASISSDLDQPGILRIQMTDPQGINGSGTLLELEFESTPAFTEPSPLSVTVQAFTTEEEPISIQASGVSLLPLAPGETSEEGKEEPPETEEQKPQVKKSPVQRQKPRVRRRPKPRRRVARRFTPRERPSLPSPTPAPTTRFLQKPEVVLSDGKETVIVTVPASGKRGTNISYSLLNGELVRRPVVRGQQVEFHILPSPGTSRTVLYLLGEKELQVFELQVFPPVDIDFDRSGVIDEHLRTLLLQQMGKRVGEDRSLRRYDLNGDGMIDDDDLAIFSANYEKKRGR
ncbi:MAG: hypothetical protein D6736_08710 [Nitrospinota bacterium]|nr:MAG: hypothetical protein D6736_08710 [Nitrospinota bacterium]